MTLSSLLVRLKTAHEFYVKEKSEPVRGKILEAMENTFKILPTYGLDYSFGVLCVLYGDAFTMAEFGWTMDDLSLRWKGGVSR